MSWSIQLEKNANPPETVQLGAGAHQAVRLIGYYFSAKLATVDEFQL